MSGVHVQAGWRRPGPVRPGEETWETCIMAAAGRKCCQLLTHHCHRQKPQRTQGTARLKTRSKVVQAIGVKRFLYLLQSSLAFLTVSASCSLYLNYKKNLLNPANRHKKQQLSNAFLLKEIQSLSVFCLHYFQTNTSVWLCRITLRKKVQWMMLCCCDLLTSLYLFYSYLWIQHQINLSLWNQGLVLFVLSGCCRRNGCTEWTSRMA